MTAHENILERRCSIDLVYNVGLCTGCGTCAIICMNKAITFRRTSDGFYRPMINYPKCTHCSMCIEVCPSPILNRFVGSKEIKQGYLGNFINCYIGRSTIKNPNFASGGLATSTLIFAFENKIIDGAIVTKMNKYHPLESEVFIARNSQEVLSASGSKYCPVVTNLKIKDILNEDGKFAIVGLPCQIRGIRKAEKINKRLREKIVLHIGLFCHHTPSYLGTEFLLQRLGIDSKDVVSINYRGKGWPGYVVIGMRGGNERSITLNDLGKYLVETFFFTPLCCTICNDHTNELADISLGDAWMPELMKREWEIGWSVIVSRSEIGESILKGASSKRIIKIRPISSDKVKQSQGSILIFKKKNIKARISIFNLLHKNIHIIYEDGVLNPLACLSAIIIYLIIYVSFKPRLRQILKYIPFPLFKAISLSIRALNRV